MGAAIGTNSRVYARRVEHIKKKASKALEAKERVLTT